MQNCIEINNLTKKFEEKFALENINLTLDGKCKLCGDSYDIAMHDWILTDAPIELTK